MMNFLTKIFGTRNDKLLRQIRPLVVRINELETGLKELDNASLASKTVLYRERLAKGEALNSLLPEAFATAREASSRVLGLRHYDVQLVGGIVLNQGKIAEMKTGEGKTLTATLACYLRGLAGEGAHVVTVNDYLAVRDAEWMGQLYNFLGLSVGIIRHGLHDRERKTAYGSDITYGTNNEFGFDYLRDNMKTSPEQLVQRSHGFAIVDEVDSILIDEARTPLIISGPSDTSTELYKVVNAAIPGLQKDSDYLVDEKSRVVSLTEDGITKLEKRLRIENLYDPQHIEWLHHSQQALKAHIIFKKDVDYVVRDGEVLIVDEFTGRLMPGRRYSDGLHGALEAKEHVTVQQETQTLATITFQNFFRLYKVLSGMTGTADTEAVEFKKIYNLDVVVIPTNQPQVRQDEHDVIFYSAREKFDAIAEDIFETQATGQPILVGTVSVEKSELLANLLRKRQIPHEILNAKNHAREAAIIAAAGERGHVTISTNMAGRGTDIKLGEGVSELGGLYVIGTERHESRRIDNQLRGRSGRQGDPGRSRFYLSFEDDLLRRFASDWLNSYMAKNMNEGEAFVDRMFTSVIEKSQNRVEQYNFSSRKHVLEYDDVMNQQRQVVYGRRRMALLGEYEVDFVDTVVEKLVRKVFEEFAPETTDGDSWPLDLLDKHIRDTLHQEVDLKLPSAQEGADARGEDLGLETLIHRATSQILASYAEQAAHLGLETLKKYENFTYLQFIDQLWKEHLLAMDTLKDSVSLRGYGQRDPLQEYKREAFTLFASLMERLEEETTLNLLHVRLPPPEQLAAMGFAAHTGNDIDSSVSEETAVSARQPPAASLVFSHGPGSSPPPPVAAERLIYPPRAAAPVKPASNPTPQTFRRDAEKVGRNDPCPCGSGKKYKKCHGSEET